MLADTASLQLAADALPGDRLASFEQAHWVKTENKPIYDHNHLKEHTARRSLH